MRPKLFRLFFCLFRADEIADCAARLTSGLAGCLAFAAAFELNSILQRHLIDRHDMFGHISTSYITESFLLFYHRYTRKEIEKSVSFLLSAFLSLAQLSILRFI
jgi:hypothetical protein